MFSVTIIIGSFEKLYFKLCGHRFKQSNTIFHRNMLVARTTGRIESSPVAFQRSSDFGSTLLKCYVNVPIYSCTHITYMNIYH